MRQTIILLYRTTATQKSVPSYNSSVCRQLIDSSVWYSSTVTAVRQDTYTAVISYGRGKLVHRGQDLSCYLVLRV